MNWWFGAFYDDDLDQPPLPGAWNPTPLVTVEFTGDLIPTLTADSRMTVANMSMEMGAKNAFLPVDAYGRWVDRDDIRMMTTSE